MASDWQPIRIRAHGRQTHMEQDWLCYPAWDIVALYPQADEERPHPKRADRRQWLFHDRHIDRRFHIEYPRSSRDGLRTVSATIGDPAREWEIMIEHRDRYLRDAGLTLESPAEAIAHCLAETFRYTSYFGEKPYCPTFPENARALNNPIEGLLFQSHCVGCAHAYACLADAAGLRVRTIGCGAHRVAEVLVDGHWRMVDNGCRHERSKDMTALYPASFMAITQRPQDFPETVSAKKAADYGGMMNGQYHFLGGTWQCPKTLRFAANCAAALYPDAEHWGFKSDDGLRMPIALRKSGFYWEDGVHCGDGLPVEKRRPYPLHGHEAMGEFLYAELPPGGQVRQSFWLGDLDGMDAVEISLPLVPVEPLESLGTALHVRIGDDERTLAGWGAWPPTPITNRGHRDATITVPSPQLRPQAVNWITLENHGAEPILVPCIPAAMEPYIPPIRV